MYLCASGKREIKLRAVRGVSGSPQAATMRLNNRAADRKSDAGAVGFGGNKRIEDLVRLLRSKPNTSVADGDQKLLAFRSPRLDG